MEAGAVDNRITSLSKVSVIFNQIDDFEKNDLFYS